MTKQPIHYTTNFNQIVYKDLKIRDLVVGHTTQFTKRKNAHKTACNNDSSPEYYWYVYRFIRDNCGWVNFDMILIEHRACTDKLHAE